MSETYVEARPVAASADQRRIAAARDRVVQASELRRRLIATDVLMVLGAWLATPLAPWVSTTVGIGWGLVSLGLAAVTVGLLALAGLYRARVCAVRSAEALRLAYVSVAVGFLGVGTSSVIVEGDVGSAVVVGTVVAFVALLSGRSVYRNWLLARRATGKLLRPVAIIGADHEASRLSSHLAEYPELGYQVVGFFRSSQGQAAHLARPVLGQAAEAAGVLRDMHVDGAIVVPGALLPAELDVVLGSLSSAKIHVHLATGLRGIDSRRLRWLPMGHEPLLYLEPAGASSPFHDHAKRMIDVVGATVGLVLTAPLLALAAIAIKLSDGGPVLFRQERAGMGSRRFMVLKLRSMTVDAEERLNDLLEHNEREGGPLFKVSEDPRVTKVGAILRATSLDEIPQLVNVLRGEMSLVGPRPAIPRELEAFDDVLMVRQQVRPGVTGLWQVEARDNPAFSAYRYLDVFYVENQSLALDFTILVATVRAVINSAVRAIRGRGERPAAGEPAGLPSADFDVRTQPQDSVPLRV